MLVIEHRDRLFRVDSTISNFEIPPLPLAVIIF